MNADEKREAIDRMAEAMWRLDSDQIEQIGWTFEKAPSSARYLALANAALGAFLEHACPPPR